MKDLTLGKLDEALEVATQRKDDSLQKCLDRLEQTDENCETITHIFTDHAPLSFYFARYRNEQFSGNGGIIFHGVHDNGGDGSAPTFSVNLTPTNGWAIHT